jgi:serine/threonine protein phosphatase PrpC
MGCVSSNPKAVVDDPNDLLKAQQAAQQQRRRLSVNPQHVGDISGNGPKAPEPEAAKPDAKIDHLPDDRDGLTESEYKCRGKVRHASLSKKGFVPYNKNKVNQDREVVKFALQNDESLSLFAVMDGHGEFGHFVANFVKEKLPEYLAKQSNLKSDPPQAISVAVKEMVDDLHNTNINIAFSGTTAIFGVKVDQTLYIANIGDSRCVLAHQKEDGTVEAIALSTDQKPENPAEKARILSKGGRVEPLPGPPGEDCGPPRVWLADVDVPGLAMSRSIGDEVSQTVGVISEPEILQHNIDPRDLFCVFATDGVWEFISNQEAIELVNRHRKDLKTAADELVKQANERWTKEEEVVDDITCIILDFQPL